MTPNDIVVIGGANLDLVAQTTRRDVHQVAISPGGRACAGVMPMVQAHLAACGAANQTNF